MEPSSPIPGARFVDPSVLARIGNLELIAKAVVDGFINGLHKAPFYGSSVDFAEHRGYVPGDDVRRIDWRVFARTERFYVKEYEADTNSNFSVLLDMSKSMDFGTRGITKFEYARILAGCLTNLVHRQRDRVGLVAFDDDIREHVPPSAKHMEVVLHTLDKLVPVRAGTLLRPMKKLAEFFGRRGLLVVISDLYEEPEAVAEAIGPLRFRGNDVIVFHMLDPSELDFTFPDASSFEDLESGVQIPVVPEGLRDEYRALVKAHTDAVQKKLAGHRVDYAVLDTSKPLDFALFSYLNMRARLMRTR